MFIEAGYLGAQSNAGGCVPLAGWSITVDWLAASTELVGSIVVLSSSSLQPLNKGTVHTVINTKTIKFVRGTKLLTFNICDPCSIKKLVVHQKV
ncbi:hypothetical protein B5J92_01570 [Moraxella atlantae]|nr:hypothetical protein B5J92_01570 [Moraxella atlantae]